MISQDPSSSFFNDGSCFLLPENKEIRLFSIVHRGRGLFFFLFSIFFVGVASQTYRHGCEAN